MSGSQDINYALISALYASGTNGLYSDVYFPIIKYTIVQLFNNKAVGNSTCYFTSQDVSDYIEDKFKLHIPYIVIAKSIQKIDKTKRNFVDLDVMESGNTFQIKKVWDSHEFDELIEREAVFTNGLKNIESDYKFFLEQNGSYDDGVTYLQFIADNTQEVLGYFQNSDTSVINEKYATIIFFLEYLHQTPSKKEEFVIADQLFWASIIAGYLKSEKPFVDAAEDGCKKEYFLDTSILLAMMKLSTRQKESYAQEVRDIIVASGGIMRAHPMTLEEIKKILGSVEASGVPDPGTDIAEAWENYHYNINKIASIRLGLQTELEKIGVHMFPNLGVEDCKRIERSYVGRKTVDELARERSRKPVSYGLGDFREIHDLFMDDFIKERRKEKGGSEDIVFVTANRELIYFTKRLHPETLYMVSTGRIVLELWMHNAKPSDISHCALTETMARCLDQHNVRVRGKIMEVSRFFNENKGKFDTKVYQDFIRKLYRRAKNVIMAVEVNPEEQDAHGDLTAQRIIDAMKADQEYYDKRIEESEAKNAVLSNQLTIESLSKEALVKTNKLHENHIESLYKRNTKLSDMISEVSEQLSDSKKMVSELTHGKKNAEAIVALYKKRDELKLKLNNIIAELVPLEQARKLSFKNRGPKYLYGLGISILLGGAVVVGYALMKEIYGIIALGAIFVSLGIFFLNRANNLNDKVKERQALAYEKWENAKDNINYSLLNAKKSELEKEIANIEKCLEC